MVGCATALDGGFGCVGKINALGKEGEEIPTKLRLENLDGCLNRTIPDGDTDTDGDGDDEENRKRGWLPWEWIWPGKRNGKRTAGKGSWVTSPQQ
jgi:hypothetical protein